jgi:sigma-B regulation protein RsbU (phosphoserine phosphatase)
MTKNIQNSSVLIIDSMRSNAEMICSILKKNGITKIAQAETGISGLEKAINLHPDVVLLNISLPDISGLNVCKELKNNPKTKNISIIMQGPATNALEKREAFHLGANDFITEPIDTSELIYRLMLQLKQRALYINLLKTHHKMEKELKESAALLSSFLPSQSDLQKLSDKYNISIDSFYLPSAILGGDFYNAFPINEQKLGFYLWDFSGHGVIAAINTLRLSSAIYNNRHTKDPGEFITYLNNTLYNLNSINLKGSFATIFYGIINKQEMTLDYSYASCPKPLLLSIERNAYQVIDTREFPLGIISDHIFQTKSISLKGWDTIILYSDALIETQSEIDDKFLTQENLAEMLLETFRGNSKIATSYTIKERIISEVDNHYRKNLKDDLTLEIIKF